MSSTDPYEVIIIGAGVAGLTAACTLEKAGINYQLLEAEGEVGGRVRTDEKEGYLLDHGFQIFLTAYPEARDLLDYDALQLHSFYKGADVWLGGRFERVADPLQHPVDGAKSLMGTLSTFNDKLKVLSLQQKLLRHSPDAYWKRPEQTTQIYLKEFGFSDSFIDGFFRPFFGGIYLERALNTSSRMFEFLFRIFGQGDATLPARGMRAIPEQLAARLKPGRLSLNNRVRNIQGQSLTEQANAILSNSDAHTQPLDGLIRLTLENGETLQTKTLLVATDARSGQALDGKLESSAFNGCLCFYFAAMQADVPITDPILILNGQPGETLLDGAAVLNNVCVPSLVVPFYAPSGQHLISVTVIPAASTAEPFLIFREAVQETLLVAVQAGLRAWFGPSVDQWRHLKTYVIPDALPVVQPGKHSLQKAPALLSSNRFVCGDYRESPSLNGAMASGRRAAEAILEQLKKPG